MISLLNSVRTRKINKGPRILIGVVVAATIVATLALSCSSPHVSAQDKDPEAVAAEPAAEQSSPERLIPFTPEQCQRYGIAVRRAAGGKLVSHAILPGEVRLNADHVARIVPRLGGIVTEVKKNLGDSVRAGEAVAAVESGDLATAKGAWLAAKAKLDLAQITYEREKNLWERRISAEQDFLNAKQDLAQARIDARSAEHQLRALGLGSNDLKAVASQSPDTFTRLEVTSPIQGTVIEKHVVLGDSVQPDTALYVVADLSTVWVDLSVPSKDIVTVRIGQKVTVAAQNGPEPAENEIAYVGPVVEQGTRAALARVILPNEDTAWKPGMFVSGLVEGAAVEVKVLVPRDAIQQIEGKPSLFVKKDGGFRATAVVLGRANETDVEILSGIEPGDTYAATGAFMIKADLEKSKAGEE